MRDPAQLLVEAFSTLTRTIPADEIMFGSPSLQASGICDGTQGVQWNAWIEWDGARQMAYAGVNLEGLIYRGWPVARLIERELARPTLPGAKHDVDDPRRVEVIWYRDAWQVAARPPIREKLIAGSPLPLHALTDESWAEMLTEAWDCLDASRAHRGRAQQKLTTTSGKKRVYSVSPHFQLRQAFWPREATRLAGWRASLDETMSNLRPLHRAVTQLAR
jgi:hypothetical protein